MQLSPRYGSDPVVTLDGSPAAILEPTIRQRRRLADALASFSEEQWAHPSRCAGWSNRDVIIHLDSTNNFWAFSIGAGVRGEPTQFLATFDPVASPAKLVAGSTGVSAGEALDRFVASTDALAAVLTSLSDDDWSARAESPIGHVSISVVAHHALWDAWVHERDILLPLGVEPIEEADEVTASLRYVASLGPALSVDGGTAAHGTLAVAVTRPAVSFVVEISDRVVVRTGSSPADLLLAGDAVDLLEALSARKAMSQSVPAELAWMVGGLAVVFDAAPD